MWTLRARAFFLNVRHISPSPSGGGKVRSKWHKAQKNTRTLRFACCEQSAREVAKAPAAWPSEQVRAGSAELTERVSIVSVMVIETERAES